MGLLKHEFTSSDHGLGELLVPVASVDALCALLSRAGYPASPKQVAHTLVDIHALAGSASVLLQDLQRQAASLSTATHISLPDDQQLQRLSSMVAVRFLLNRLAPANRVWLVEDAALGPVLEVWQFLTQRPLPGRPAFTLDVLGWRQFLQSFGSDTFSHCSAGPWIAPDQPSICLVEQGAEWQFPVLAESQRVWWLASDDAEQLRQKLNDSYVLHQNCQAVDGEARSHAGKVLKASRKGAAVAICIGDSSHSHSAIQTHDLGILAAQLLEAELDGTGLLGLPTLGAFEHGELDTTEQGSIASALNGLPDWSALPRRRFLNDMVTVTRPSTQWQMSGRDEPASDWKGALDHYFADTAEVNPGVPAQVFNLAHELAFPLFSERFPANYHGAGLVFGSAPALAHDFGLKAVYGAGLSGRVVENAEVAAFSRCLASRSGISLLTLEPHRLYRLQPLLKSLTQQLHWISQAGDVPCWAGIPIVVTADSSERSIALSDSGVSQAAVRSFWVPDTQTVLTAVRHCLGEFGAVHVIHAPSYSSSFALSHAQASELMEQGAVCLRGNCASQVQVVACGAKALMQAQVVCDHLHARKMAFSLVYLAEPNAYPGWNDRSSSDDAMAGYFPPQVSHRLLLTEVLPSSRGFTQAAANSQTTVIPVTGNANAGTDRMASGSDMAGDSDDIDRWLSELFV